MRGKDTFQKRVQKIQRKKGPVVSPVIPPVISPQRIDIGDWSIIQDEDGSLVIHNVSTGNRIVMARP